MKSNVFKFILSISVISIHNASHASHTHTKKYTFNDFDIRVFMNHITKKVELFYPSPVVEEVTQNSITISKLTIDELVYTALASLAFKKSAMALRGCTTFYGYYDQTPAQKEEVNKYWEAEKRSSATLDEIYAKIKAIESIPAKDFNVTITARDLMLLAQHTARKIEYSHGAVAIVTDKEGRFKSVLHQPVDELFRQYRTYENTY